MEKKHSVVAPRQWKCRKCDETVRKSDKNFHVRGKELETRTSKISIKLPLKTACHYKDTSM